MAEILGPESTGGYIKARDHLDHLVIITAVHNVVKKYDQKRQMEVDNLDVDFHCFHCTQGAPPERVLIGAPYVASKIRRDGNLTLGYITQLAAKPGFEDGAIVLSEPRAEDIAPVSAWWDQVKTLVVQGPVSADPPQQPPPPASPSWGAPAAAPAPQAPPTAWGAPPPTSTVTDPAAPSWGAPAPTVAPPPPPAAAAAPPSAPPVPAEKPHPDAVRNLPLASVQALISQGLITAEEARFCGHAV